MPRRIVIIAWGALGVVVLVLAVALARVGTELDEAKLERMSRQTDVDDLEQEVDDLTDEQQQLQAKVDEQLKTIEQLKADLERTRAQTVPVPASPQAPTASETTAP